VAGGGDPSRLRFHEGEVTWWPIQWGKGGRSGTGSVRLLARMEGGTRRIGWLGSTVVAVMFRGRGQ
jgi:hypothetical protein